MTVSELHQGDSGDMHTATDPQRDELIGITQLVGDRASILQEPAQWDPDRGGGDIDCAAARVDPLWPLRLPGEWRLCQSLNYMASRYQWILEREGTSMILDVMEDGKGREYGLSSERFLSDRNPMSPPLGRALYLTEKRVGKDVRSPARWQEIAALAAADEDGYRVGLKAIYGRRLGDQVADAGLSGTPPDQQLMDTARRARHLRRINRPVATLILALQGMARLAGRTIHPTGLSVVVVGPDGSGKSTVAEELIERCRPFFRRSMHAHWRPNVLPRLGGSGSEVVAAAEDPHGQRSRGTLSSTVALLYHWADFFIGGWFRALPFRARSGLIVTERGWLDVSVDPRRYRLRPRPRLTLFLSRFLPKPDLVIALEADPSVITARKSEISQEEMARQTSSWRSVLARTQQKVCFIDASRPVEEVVDVAYEAAAAFMEDRTMARLSRGWTGGPRRAGSRWILPRGPRKTAVAGLTIFQPVTTRGRIAWEVARAAGRFGAFRLLPRGVAPPSAVRKALAAYVPPRGTVAVAKANHPGRYTALLLSDEARPVAVAKVALDEAGRRNLGSEYSSLERSGGSLGGGIRTPRVLDRSDDVLLLEFLDWRPRSRPWELPPEVARALGELFATAGTPDAGPCHGDCAPWNLLALRTGEWALIDWESAHGVEQPFFDVFHFIVQSHALLGRPSHKGILEGLEGAGWIGRCLTDYATAAGLEVSRARDWFSIYCKSSRGRLDPTAQDGRRGIEARLNLLTLLEA